MVSFINILYVFYNSELKKNFVKVGIPMNEINWDVKSVYVANAGKQKHNFCI